jgi:hypothetical protein
VNLLPVGWMRVSSQWPNEPPSNNFGYDHTWRGPGTLPDEEYERSPAGLSPFPVDERAPTTGTMECIHCSTGHLPRLLHRSVVINLDGESYRLCDHHAATETSDTPPPAPANRYTEPAIR